MIPKCCNVYNTTLSQPIILSCYYRHVAWQSARDANGPVAAAAAHVLQPTGVILQAKRSGGTAGVDLPHLLGEGEGGGGLYVCVTMSKQVQWCFSHAAAHAVSLTLPR